MTPRPPELQRARDELIREIYAAFDGVSREGGVSWSQSDVRDGCGLPEQEAAARALDQDVTWMELVDDPNWNPDRGPGAFSFLDAIGFRYYLPAGMMRCIHSGHDRGLVYRLERVPVRDRGSLFDDHFQLFDARQRRCVARFVWYMLQMAEYNGDEFEWSDWSAAWDGYWVDVK